MTFPVDPDASAGPRGATRRRALQLCGTSLVALGAPGLASARKTPRIRIGYWPVAAGLPFFAAMEKGFFKEAGLDVQALKFAGPQQVAEAMISGRAEGSANGTGTAVLAIAEIAQPGLLKILCTNPTNQRFVLDQFIVATASPLSSMAQLAGKRVGCGPGVQNRVMARAVLERAGVQDARVIELPIGQHIAALTAGQVDACYTLEPTGTIGRLAGTTRNLEVGVVARYVLGDPMAPWHGGAASLTSAFIGQQPEVTQRYVAAYRKGVDLVRQQPAEARRFLSGYTAIEGSLAMQVPMSDYRMSTEFEPADRTYFQKFFDLFTARGVFSRRVDAAAMLYQP